jgi:outer membrane protein
MHMTKWLGITGVSLACTFIAGSAFAQNAPPAQVGFQMALRTGYAIPMGAADKNEFGTEEKMSDFTGGQVPLIIDIGGKVIPSLFLGAYLGFGFGGVAGATKNLCDTNGVDCSTASVRVGIEGQFHFIPDGDTNPWIGYGFGYESMAVGGSKNGQDFSVAVAGLEPVHLMGGLDFRLSRVFGLGPFVDYSIGTYSHIQLKENGASTDGDVTSTATHSWLTLGARFVFFP